MVVVGAAHQIEHRAVRLHGVKPEAAADDKTQIQVLKPIIFVVVEDVHKQARNYVVVISDPAADCLGGARTYAIDQGGSLDSGEDDAKSYPYLSDATQ